MFSQEKLPVSPSCPTFFFCSFSYFYLNNFLKSVHIDHTYCTAIPADHKDMVASVSNKKREIILKNKFHG
jgi:hypothetical protein